MANAIPKLGNATDVERDQASRSRVRRDAPPTPHRHRRRPRGPVDTLRTPDYTGRHGQRCGQGGSPCVALSSRAARAAGHSAARQPRSRTRSPAPRRCVTSPRHWPSKDATIALGGFVGRAENRAMLRYLNIPLVPVGDLPLVDPTPSSRWSTPSRAAATTRCRTACGRRSSSTIIRSTSRSTAFPFADMRDGYGATSTILTEYLMDIAPAAGDQDRHGAVLRHHGRDAGSRARGHRPRHGGDALPLSAHQQAPPGQDRERARAARVLRRLPRRRSSRR